MTIFVIPSLASFQSGFPYASLLNRVLEMFRNNSEWSNICVLFLMRACFVRTSFINSIDLITLSTYSDWRCENIPWKKMLMHRIVSAKYFILEKALFFSQQTSNWNLNGTNTSRNCDSSWIFNVLTNLFEFKFTIFCSRNQTTWKVLYNGSDKTIRLIFSNIAPTSIAVIISGVSTFVWYSLT